MLEAQKTQTFIALLPRKLTKHILTVDVHRGRLLWFCIDKKPHVNGRAIKGTVFKRMDYTLSTLSFFFCL